MNGLAKVFAQVEFIVRRYPLVEKIKTIGDAFMCSSGLLGASTLEDVTAVADLALDLHNTKVNLFARSLARTLTRAKISFTSATLMTQTERRKLSRLHFVLACTAGTASPASYHRSGSRLTSLATL